jgi:hypothetical protein
MPTARVKGAATRAKSAEMCMVAVLVVVEVVLRSDLDDEDLNEEILRTLYTVLWLTLTRCRSFHIHTSSSSSQSSSLFQFLVAFR